jgi:eukaryotic-like serine/threonine-protein kinase
MPWRRRVTQEEVAAGPPRRDLNLWPWLLLLLLFVAALIVAAVLLTHHNSKPKVPNVVGLTTATAVRQLRQHGYVADVQTRLTSASPAGTVLSQDPAGGTKLDHGSRVRVVSARGASTGGVPDLVGLKVDAALARLRAVDLRGSTRKESSTRPAGVVLSQSPLPAKRVPKGSTVLLTVSKGGSELTVPKVVGLSESTATKTLQGAGFKAGVTRTDSAEKAGLVLSQDPAAGTKSAKGSLVGITVSKGPTTTGPTTTGPTTTGPTAGTKVPKVVGMGQSAALAQLERSGFRVDSFPVTSTRTRGLVLSQTPAAGTRAPPRTVVRLSVSLGPGTRPLRVVPDVRGKSEADAKRILVQVGFTARALGPSDNTASEVVVRQKPDAGVRVRAGSQVLLYLGAAAQ